jgi:hypothetical protein
VTLQGSTPHSPTARHRGHTTVPVRPGRTQSLRAGDQILRNQRRYTITEAPAKKPEGWLVTFEDSAGVRKMVTKPAGFIWSVLYAETIPRVAH